MNHLISGNQRVLICSSVMLWCPLVSHSQKEEVSLSLFSALIGHFQLSRIQILDLIKKSPPARHPLNFTSASSKLWQFLISKLRSPAINVDDSCWLGQIQYPLPLIAIDNKQQRCDCTQNPKRPQQRHRGDLCEERESLEEVRRKSRDGGEPEQCELQQDQDQQREGRELCGL